MYIHIKNAYSAQCVDPTNNQYNISKRLSTLNKSLGSYSPEKIHFTFHFILHYRIIS